MSALPSSVDRSFRTLIAALSDPVVHGPQKFCDPCRAGSRLHCLPRYGSLQRPAAALVRQQRMTGRVARRIVRALKLTTAFFLDRESFPARSSLAWRRRGGVEGTRGGPTPLAATIGMGLGTFLSLAGVNLSFWGAERDRRRQPPAPWSSGRSKTIAAPVSLSRRGRAARKRPWSRPLEDSLASLLIG
jgi:hypothetical protein